MKGEDFIDISHRGRLAFLIDCLEKIIAHQQLTDRRWQEVLNILWTGVEDNYFYMPNHMCSKTPEVIKRYSDFSSYTSEHPDPQPYNILNETEFLEFKTIYSQSFVANECLEWIVEFAHNPLYGEINNSQELEIIQEVINMLNHESIELPAIVEFKFSTCVTVDDIKDLGLPFTREDVRKPIA